MKLNFNVKLLFVLFCIAVAINSNAQVNLTGWVLKKNGQGFPRVEIKNNNLEIIAKTDTNGFFTASLQDLNNEIMYFGYVGKKKIFGVEKNIGNKKFVSDTVYENSGLDILPLIQIFIQGNDPFSGRIEMRDVNQVVNLNNSVESFVKTLIGVSSNNELSSNYAVRGGSYDENLIYVNDVEIYRPQLISSGQQEGLSFINSDLVKNINFSAGGFEAHYGDKMSSVLDVNYKNMDSNECIVNLGRLYNSAFLGTVNKKKNFKSLVGVRYFSNSLLTKSLDVSGSYGMNFVDAQTLLKWRISPHFRAEFLGNYASNNYRLYPASRSTEFGTVGLAYQLFVNMAGSENMQYKYTMGALSLIYNPTLYSEIKFIGSSTLINEQELFDVFGAYLLSELDKNPGSKTFGKPLRALGYGFYIDHGRNVLTTQVYNASLIYTLKRNRLKNNYKIGMRVQSESIIDKFHEWRYNDSADYNIPPFGFATDSIILDDFVSSNNQLSGQRIQAFIENKRVLHVKSNLQANLGVRGQYWTVNGRTFITPRFNLSWEPGRNRKKARDTTKALLSYVLKFAVGAYYQAPFYRELRDFSGNLNTNLKEQRAYHVLLGSDRYLKIWNRVFKHTTEAWGKLLDNQIPYLYDNIRIRYYAQNSSHGYAWGFDNRLNGEFIKGVESWFTLSILQSQEKIDYVNSKGEKTTSDWLRRPTDRRANFSCVFQDHLAKRKDFRVNISLLIGTGLPYFLDGSARYSTRYNTIPAYRRLDMGFIKVFKSSEFHSKSKLLKPFSNVWASIDIFNMLDISNVISYSWVKDFSNRTYGVPEYLTRRRLNVRLHLEF